MATETEVKTLPKPVRYISRYLQLRIVRKPGYSKEVDGQRVSTPGTSIQFDQGVFETTDPHEVDFIESRPEFGKLIQRVPDNIENIAEARDEKYQDLEARERAIAEKEAELARKEAELKDSETGKLGNEQGAGKGDGLDELKRDALVEIAQKEGVEEALYKVGTKNSDIVLAIRANRAEKPAFNE